MAKETPPPIETLIEQLHGTDWTLRCDAARLLGQSRDPRAVDALLPDLNDSDWRVRRNAAQALGALRDKRALEPLMQALKDRTMTVRQRAIVALGRIRDSQALPALLDIVLDNKHESYDAAKAVRKFGKKALPEIATAYEKNKNRQLMSLLIEMKYEGAFDLLLPSLESSDPIECLSAIRELGRLGNQKAIPYLLDQLTNHDLMVQIQAVQALASVGANKSIPILLSLLTDDELYGPRTGLYHAVTEALQILAGISTEIKNAFPGNYPPMFNMGGAPFDLPQAMGLMGNLQADALLNAFAQFQNGFGRTAENNDVLSGVVRKNLDDMAWKFGVMFADASDARQDRVKRLIELLAADEPLKRSAAALSLPWYTDERSLAPLQEHMQDPDEQVRIAATWAQSALQKAISYRNQSGM